MKHLKIIIGILAFSPVMIWSCKDSQPATIKTENSNVNDTTKAMDAPAAAAKELKLGATTLHYSSSYSFVIDAKNTQSIKDMSPKIMDAGVYNLSMPKGEGKIVLNYQQLSQAPQVEKMTTDLINSYKNMDYLKISDEKIVDVSESYGYPAKMGMGKMTVNTTEDGVTNGAYQFLVIQHENATLLFQGLFFKTNSSLQKQFQEMLQSMKWKEH